MAGGSSDRSRTVRISAGHDVPYPVPSSEAATVMGLANRRRDTKPELQLRSELHRRGLRFRKDFLVRAPDAKARVDICFTRARIAVFVDGCFWHVCPIHHSAPKKNVDYWGPKFAANIERDRRVDRGFQADGWTVIRCWEHEDPSCAADRIEDVLRGRRRLGEDGSDVP
jgi:DNA mismatch endonuclease, patch repair protein